MEAVIVLLVILAILVLAVVGLVSLLRKSAGGENKHKFSDAYFYFMSFVSLIVIYGALADLARIILSRWWVDSTLMRSSTDQWLRWLSLRISAVLVALPVWFFHWHKATTKPKEEVDETSKRSYAFAFVIVMGLSGLGMTIGAAYLGVNALLGIALTTVEKQALAFALPYSLGALFLWFTHWKMWHASRAKEMVEVKKSEEEIK
jgi:hypothetical protein